MMDVILLLFMRPVQNIAPNMVLPGTERVPPGGEAPPI